MSKTFGIHIFTRDLRVYDNLSINYCVENSDCLLPIFIFTPEQLEKNKFFSHNSFAFLLETLNDLNTKQLHNNLNLFYGNYDKILNELCNIIINRFSSHYNKILITCSQDYTPFSKRRSKIIESTIKSINHQLQSSFSSTKNNIMINYVEIEDYTLFPLNTIQTQSNTVYSVFTPFYNKCLAKITNITKPTKFKKRFDICNPSFVKKQMNHSITTLGFISKKYIDSSKLSPKREIFGGRENGSKMIQQSKIRNFISYGTDRDNLNYETTKLSAYIKYGCISIREVFYNMINALNNKNHPLIRQLLWREFYAHLYNDSSHLLKGKNLKSKYDSVKWIGKNALFNKWKNGETGFPIVDACIRQLNETGYLHNRGRLICAEFLVKILLVDWKKGEKYFAQTLVDYDPVSNNGGWTWVASTGADSQPYFRIMNPWTQGEKHDVDAEYIKKWIPNLSNVEPKIIHNWYMYYNKPSYKHIYHSPIVDYKAQREKSLEFYKSIN